MPVSLEVNHLYQSYGNLQIVKDLSFRLDKGQIGCLLGPSGCGKTTVLRCIAGFEPIESGDIKLGNVIVSRAGYQLPPEKRHIGMVFQEYALFPHLTISQNIGFGLYQMEKTAAEKRIDELLNMVGLQHMSTSYPHTISGGQQQRVALARALAPRPNLLLLDEPFSNLDIELRERLSIEVREIIKQNNTTAILVTHDQNEAFALADEIGIMHEGKIQQWDSAYNLYHCPENRFIADFVGQGVFLPGTVLTENSIEMELGTLHGKIPEGCNKGALVDVLLRPDDIVHDDNSPRQAEVLKKAFRGAEILYNLRLASGGQVLSLVPSHHNHAIGEKIGIKLDIDHVVAFKR